MASDQEHAPRAQRLAALGAVGLLAVVTSVAFGRVFVGHGATWKLLAAAVTSIVVAAVLERRSLLLATVVSAGLLVVLLGLLVFPGTTWHGLPSRETLHAIRAALGRVGREARVQIAPAAPLAPLLLAAMTATWTAAFSAHALAVRAGSPLLAVLPPVALVGFADAVLEDGARPLYAIAFLVAALLVVFMDGLRRIRQWGPIWGPGRRRPSVAMGTGARRVTLLVVAVATLGPGILPGFRSPGLVEFSTRPGDSIHIDPFVSIKAQLERRDPVSLFQVTPTNAQGDPVPAYWRLYALDEFDGTTWRSSDPQNNEGQLLQTPALLASSISPSASILRQRFRVLTDLGDGWMPMAYPPQSLDSASGTIRYDRYLTAALSPEPLQAGTEYTVTSVIESPTPEELDRVSFPEGSLYPNYTYVPPGVSPVVKRLAQQWTAGAENPYRAVLAIQNRFLDGSFRYSLDVKPSTDANALVDFLTKTRVGFCQQFATAMAVMVRELGLPARVAVGFRPGTRTGDTYVVSTEDAHSWVEVLFPVYGWLAFEPTPGRFSTSPLATPGSYLNPAAPGSCPPGQKGCPPQTETTTQTGSKTDLPGPLRRAEFGAPRRKGGAVPFGPEPAKPGYGVPLRLLLSVLLAGLALMLVGVPLVKTAWRRAALGRAREPRDAVLAAVRVFTGRAADLGLGRGAGETLAEYRDRLARRVRFSDGHLERLTTAASRAAYAARPLTRDEARGAFRDARAAMRDLRRDAGVVRRVVGIYRPGV